nr:DapH/DapD/GlmU-related protein [uncultured Psychroserpens sp.]
MFFKNIRIAFIVGLANSLPKLSYFNRRRYKLLKFSGIKLGNNVFIHSPLVVIHYSKLNNIKIGDNTFINMYCRFACIGAKITIGDNVGIGPNVSFETVNHGLVYDDVKGRGTFHKPITVENKVWIGAGVIILQGVTIGEGAVICAGAVVTKDVDAYCVYGGVPAKKIKSIEVDINEKDI